MNYKLLKEENDYFLMKHPDGSDFKIAKKGLGGHVINRIKMFNGGEVPALDELPEQKLASNVDDLISSDISAGDAVAAPVVSQPVVQPVIQPVIKQTTQVPITGEDPYKKIEDATKSMASASANAFKQQELEIAKQAKIDEQRNAEYQAKANQIFAENDKISQEIAANKIDANRFWNSRTTGQKIAAGLAIALGSIGQGLKGGKGENVGVKMINDYMNRDIEEQKAELGKKQNLLSLNLQKYGNLSAAETATRMQQNAALQGKIAMFVAKANSQQATAQGQIALETLKLQQKKYAQELALKERIASGGITDEMAQTALSDEQRERFVPGEGALALSKEGAKEIRKLQADRNSSKQAIGNLIALSKKYGGELLDREAVAEAQTEIGTLQGKLRTFLVGPGAVSESERELIQNIIADPTKLLALDSANIKRLQTLERAIDTGYENALTSEGVKRKASTFKPLR